MKNVQMRINPELYAKFKLVEGEFWKERMDCDHASGSGCKFALSAMKLGLSAKDAVSHAKKLDCYTGGNKSMSTLRHFLPSSTAYITSLTVSGDTKGTDIMLRSDSNDSGDVFDGVWLFQVPITMSDAPVTVMFNPAIVIPPNARLKVSARAGASGNTVSVFINGWVKI